MEGGCRSIGGSIGPGGTYFFTLVTVGRRKILCLMARGESSGRSFRSVGHVLEGFLLDHPLGVGGELLVPALRDRVGLDELAEALDVVIAEEEARVGGVEGLEHVLRVGSGERVRAEN